MAVHAIALLVQELTSSCASYRSSVDATVKQYKLYLSKRLEEDRGVKAAQVEANQIPNPYPIL